MSEVLQFLDREIAAGHAEEAGCLRPVAECLLADGTASRFDLVPWDWLGFGIFPLGRRGDWERSPCIGVWFDDPHPLYWVQLRDRPDGKMLDCSNCMGVEEACARVAELLPRLHALA